MEISTETPEQIASHYTDEEIENAKHFLGGADIDATYTPSIGHEGISADIVAAPKRYEFEEAVGNADFDSDGWSHLNIGKLVYEQSDYSGAIVSFEEALARFEQVDDNRGIPIAHYYLGKAIYRQGEYGQARTYFQQAFDSCQASDNKHCLASTLWYLGKVSYREGQFEEAIHHFEGAHRYAVEIGDDSRIAWALNYLGKVSYRLKDYATSRAHFKQALPLFQKIGDEDAIATGMLNLAQVELALGRDSEAHLWAAESRAIYMTLDDKNGVEDCARIIESSEDAMQKRGVALDPGTQHRESRDLPQRERSPFEPLTGDISHSGPDLSELSEPSRYNPEMPAFDFTPSEVESAK
jgi:tetratricopeptide (TPR) repeat protein